MALADRDGMGQVRSRRIFYTDPRQSLTGGTAADNTIFDARGRPHLFFYPAAVALARELGVH